MSAIKTYIVDGNNRIFPADCRIVEERVQVELEGVFQSSSLYDIINDAVVFHEAPAIGVLSVVTYDDAQDLSSSGDLRTVVLNLDAILEAPVTATTQAGIATTQAGIATTKAVIAITKAGESLGSADASSSSATQALGSASDAAGSASSAFDDLVLTTDAKEAAVVAQVAAEAAVLASEAAVGAAAATLVNDVAANTLKVGISPTQATKLAGIDTSADVNVQSDWSQATTTADDYIKGKPTIPTALANITDFTTGTGVAVDTALTINNVKVPKVFIQTDNPTLGTFEAGDLWWDTDGYTCRIAVLIGATSLAWFST